MNLLETFNDPDLIIDCSISIIQEANKNGFKGFAGYCGQAATLINECLFDNKQQIFASFNKALEQNNHYIGHVACLIDLPNESYFILDSDAQLKSIEDIQHWGMLDSEDSDYHILFEKHNIKKTSDNFEQVSELVLTHDFTLKNFNCSHIEEQRKILLTSINNVLPFFIKKTTVQLKTKI